MTGPLRPLRSVRAIERVISGDVVLVYVGPLRPPPRPILVSLSLCQVQNGAVPLHRRREYFPGRSQVRDLTCEVIAFVYDQALRFPVGAVGVVLEKDLLVPVSDLVHASRVGVAVVIHWPRMAAGDKHRNLVWLVAHFLTHGRV